MRHGKKLNHLGRKTGHRKALLRNLSISLIEYKRIKTTLAKAKALRKFIEPLITKAKVNSTHSRRVVFSYIGNKEANKELFSTIADAVSTRPGGYLRIVKTGFRPSDGAEMAIIEFVDFNTVYKSGVSNDVETKKKRTRRGKKASNKPNTESIVAAESIEKVEEETQKEEE